MAAVSSCGGTDRVILAAPCELTVMDSILIKRHHMCCSKFAVVPTMPVLLTAARPADRLLLSRSACA